MPSLGGHGVLALELALTWASFSPIFPLLTAPRREALGEGEEPPLYSQVPRILCTALASAAVTITAASATRANKSGATSRMGMREPSADQRSDLNDNAGLARNLFRAAVGLLAGALVIHTAAVVLGAPILRRFPETAAFSLLISSLTSLPVWVSTSRPLEACAGFLRGTRPAVHEPAAMVPAAGCVLGAWLGAIPLCLDWEQPWQAWPLPMCAGGLLGFSAGCLLLLGVKALENVRRSFLSWTSEWRAEKRA